MSAQPDPQRLAIDLSERLGRLETFSEKAGDRLVTIEKDVAVVKSNYARRADVSDAKRSIILWLIVALFAIAGIPLAAALVVIAR